MADAAGSAGRGRLQRYRGPLLLSLLQIAPLTVAPDSTGRLVVSLGYGRGEFEARSYTCADGVAKRILESVMSGISLSFSDDDYRISAFYGTARGADPPQGMTTINGGFGGAMLSVEKEGIGYGGGISMYELLGNPGEAGPKFVDLEIIPQLHLRLGDADAVHFRLAVGAESPAGLPPSLWSIGVGYGLGRERKIGASIAYASMPFTNHPAEGVLISAFVPLTRTFDFMGSGYLGGEEGNTDRFYSVGARIHLRR